MLPRRGEACQRDDLDRVLLLTAAVSIQGVVELWPVEAFVQFVVFGHGPTQRVAAIHDPHVGFNSLRAALLEAKGGERGGDGGGSGSGGGAVAARTLELGQARGHPAAVRVAQYKTLLGAGLRGFSQGFLQVHLDSCKNERHTQKKKKEQLI